MSEIKHTPGEWLLAGTPKTFIYALNDRGYNRFSASLQQGHMSSDIRTDEAELEANGRLIAAAPDLLEALQTLYDYVGDPINFPGSADGVFEKACAAIAKATGA